MVDAGRGRVRAVHDHARQHGGLRRAVLDPGATSRSRPPSSSGSSAATRSPSPCSCSRGGKLADMFGRRRIFIVGLAIFTASSLACGLATGAEFLIGARVVQGVGAALMNPATLSIIIATFPPRQRGTAIGIWVGVSAMALAIGPLVGGLLTEHINWSWIFFINVPVGIAGIIVARLVIDESPRRVGGAAARPARADLLGHRALRAHVRPDRGEQLRLDVRPHPRQLRRRGRRARDLRPARASPARADARPLALQELDLRRRERGHAARRARDVRRLLLQLALPRPTSSATRRSRPAPRSCR